MTSQQSSAVNAFLFFLTCLCAKGVCWEDLSPAQSQVCGFTPVNEMDLNWLILKRVEEIDFHCAISVPLSRHWYYWLYILLWHLCMWIVVVQCDITLFSKTSSCYFLLCLKLLFFSFTSTTYKLKKSKHTMRNKNKTETTHTSTRIYTLMPPSSPTHIHKTNKNATKKNKKTTYKHAFLKKNR